jgi:hypothetical protein
VDVIAAPEAVEDVTDTSATASEDWLTEGALGVGNDLRSLVRRQPDQPRISVAVVRDAVQIRLDDLRKDTLATADDHELSNGIALVVR